MTVHVENLGSTGAVNFPVKPLRDLLFFFEDFRRPPDDPNRIPVALPQITCSGLGPNWLNQWISAEHIHSPINPTVAIVAEFEGECAFQQRRSGRAMTIVTATRTAWIGTIATGHYAEFRMRRAPQSFSSFTYVVTNWSLNPGTSGYFPGCQSQPGFFYIRSGRSTSTGFTTSSLGVGYTYYDTTLDPEPGVVYTQLLPLPDAPLGTMKRLESLYMNPGWNLRVLFDGELVAELPRAENLFVGAPGMACSTEGRGEEEEEEEEPITVATLQFFRCGWLQ